MAKAVQEKRDLESLRLKGIRAKEAEKKEMKNNKRNSQYKPTNENETDIVQVTRIFSSISFKLTIYFPQFIKSSKFYFIIKITLTSF